MHDTLDKYTLFDVNRTPPRTIIQLTRYVTDELHCRYTVGEKGLRKTAYADVLRCGVPDDFCAKLSPQTVVAFMKFLAEDDEFEYKPPGIKVGKV
jgi:hypothetical protein